MNENVVFYLTFKKDLKFLYDTLPVSQAIILMRAHGYRAVPVLNAAGEYVGSVDDGDFLYFLCDHLDHPELIENSSVKDVMRPGFMPAVDISVPLCRLLEMALHQNYVPVVDDRNCFMGIVTRQSLMRHFAFDISQKNSGVQTGCSI